MVLRLTMAVLGRLLSLLGAGVCVGRVPTGTGRSTLAWLVLSILAWVLRGLVVLRLRSLWRR